MGLRYFYVEDSFYEVKVFMLILKNVQKQKFLLLYYKNFMQSKVFML